MRVSDDVIFWIFGFGFGGLGEGGLKELFTCFFFVGFSGLGFIGKSVKGLNGDRKKVEGGKGCGDGRWIVNCEGRGGEKEL